MESSRSPKCDFGGTSFKQLEFIHIEGQTRYDFLQVRSGIAAKVPCQIGEVNKGVFKETIEYD